MRNRCVIKTIIGIRCDMNNLWYSTIQYKQMSAPRINCHPLRFLKLKLPCIISGDHIRFQKTVGICPYSYQFFSSEPVYEQSVCLLIKSYINRSYYIWYKDRTNLISDRGHHMNLKTFNWRLSTFERIHAQESLGSGRESHACRIRHAMLTGFNKPN